MPVIKMKTGNIFTAFLAAATAMAGCSVRQVVTMQKEGSSLVLQDQKKAPWERVLQACLDRQQEFYAKRIASIKDGDDDGTAIDAYVASCRDDQRKACFVMHGLAERYPHLLNKLAENGLEFHTQAYGALECDAYLKITKGEDDEWKTVLIVSSNLDDESALVFASKALSTLFGRRYFRSYGGPGELIMGEFDCSIEALPSAPCDQDDAPEPGNLL